MEVAMKKDNLLEQARAVKIEDIMSHYGLRGNRYGQYSCINHKDVNPSASVDKARNKLHCFSCGKYFTTIDVVSSMENNTDIRACAKKVLEISNVPFEELKKVHKQEIKQDDNKTEKKKLTIQDRINLLDKSKDDILIKYLSNRKINHEIVLPILEQNGYIYGVDKLGQVTFIFERYNCCIIRNKQTDKNWVTGTNAPITLTYDKDNKEWYITEGLYDALSLLSIGLNVICLNSVSNVSKLKELILKNKRKMQKFTYVIATDNDKKGLEAKQELENFFENNNINYEIFGNLYSSSFKDVNELLQNDML